MNTTWRHLQPARRQAIVLLTTTWLLCGCGGTDATNTAVAAATTTLPAQTAALRPGLGAISYWGSSADAYRLLPAASLAVLNPDVGILAAGTVNTPIAALPTWQLRSAELRGRGVFHLGYVPTGYFRHDCDLTGQCQTWARIEAQVATYLTQMPQLDGLFFDEMAPTAWDCSVFAAEYARLRALVARHRRDGSPALRLAFNPGIADACVLDGLQAGEAVVVFEGTAASHAERETVLGEVTRQARQRGLQPWHLVHTTTTAAALQSVVARARQADVTWLSVTNTGGQWQADENTWGGPPPYWDELVRLLETP
jgi:Spherulation-specific family 4